MFTPAVLPAVFVRYVISLSVGILLVLGVLWFIVSINPRAFEEVLPSIARDKLELARSPDVSVLILGDSFPATSLDPSAFDAKSLNLAIPGANPIDVYQVLQESLKYSHPKAIIISLDMEHLVYRETGNNGGKTFPVLFNNDSFEELLKQSRRFNEDRNVGPASPWDIDARLTWFLRRNNFNTVSGYQLITGLMGVNAKNQTSFQYEKDHQGFLPVEIMVPVDTKLLHIFLNGDAAEHFQEFRANPLLDYYFEQILALGDVKNIPVYYVRGPEPKSSDEMISQKVKDDFSRYLGNYEKKYHQFHVLGDLFSIYPDDLFYDGIHLNHKSVGRWSSLVKSEVEKAVQNGVQE